MQSIQPTRPGPWRITFDTNPDDCNLHCIMCEEHSPYSTLQHERIQAGRPKRRMDIALIRRVLEEAQGTPCVKSSHPLWVSLSSTNTWTRSLIFARSIE